MSLGLLSEVAQVQEAYVRGERPWVPVSEPPQTTGNTARPHSRGGGGGAIALSWENNREGATGREGCVEQVTEGCRSWNPVVGWCFPAILRDPSSRLSMSLDFSLQISPQETALIISSN